MKRFFLLITSIAIFSVLVTSGCKKDEEEPCTAPAIEENILGKWEATNALGEKNTIEFKADNTFSDPNDAIVGGSTNGVDFTHKTYSVISESEIKFTASTPPDSGTSGSTSITMDVKENECNKIVMELQGFGDLGKMTFVRK